MSFVVKYDYKVKEYIRNKSRLKQFACVQLPDVSVAFQVRAARKFVNEAEKITVPCHLFTEVGD